MRDPRPWTAGELSAFLLKSASEKFASKMSLLLNPIIDALSEAGRTTITWAASDGFRELAAMLEEGERAEFQSARAGVVLGRGLVRWE